MPDDSEKNTHAWRHTDPPKHPETAKDAGDITQPRGKGRPPRSAYDADGNYLPPRVEPDWTKQADKRAQEKGFANHEAYLASIPRTAAEAKLFAAEKRALEIIEARSSLENWCRYALRSANQSPARHHLKIIQELEKVCSGETRNLIVMAPPGSAKSTYSSVLFPPYFALKNPQSSIIGASNTIRLATSFSRKVRNLIDEHRTTLGYGLDPDQQSVEQWKTDRTNRCEYLAVGAGGTILGTRADLFLIDDPYASFADAQSPTTRNFIWDWYKSDVDSRLKPGGRVVLIMTRFHEDDLCGHLLEHEPDAWKVIRLPAICEDDDDALGREIGEPLWGDYQTQEFLDAKRRTTGEIFFATNYQQRPMPASGNLFDPSKMPIVDAPPCPIEKRVRAWDLAATSGGDYTVGLKLSKLQDGRWLIEDVQRFRGDPATVESTIKQLAHQDGRSTIIRLPVDPGAAGISQNSYLTRALAGFNVKSERESGSKEIRAMPVASQAMSGNILLLKAHWNSALLHELGMFPGGRHDDQTDALSSAFTELSQVVIPMRQVRIPWMNR